MGLFTVLGLLTAWGKLLWNRPIQWLSRLVYILLSECCFELHVLDYAANENRGYDRQHFYFILRLFRFHIYRGNWKGGVIAFVLGGTSYFPNLSFDAINATYGTEVKTMCLNRRTWCGKVFLLNHIVHGDWTTRWEYACFHRSIQDFALSPLYNRNAQFVITYHWTWIFQRNLAPHRDTCIFSRRLKFVSHVWLIYQKKKIILNLWYR